MTESEWLASSDPAAMLEWLTHQGATTDMTDPRIGRRAISDRKMRLFACACCRAIWEWLTPTYGKRAILLAEAFADGQAAHSALAEAATVSGSVGQWLANPDASLAAMAVTAAAARHNTAILPAYAALLRDICGNPFRPVRLPCAHNPDAACCSRCDPGPCPWFTPQAVSLARAAEGASSPDGTLDPLTLAALADALEEAGCPLEVECPCVESARQNGTRSIACERCWFTYSLPHPLLAHLRSPGPHYRGCWALDLVLGKS